MTTGRSTWTIEGSERQFVALWVALDAIYELRAHGDKSPKTVYCDGKPYVYVDSDGVTRDASK